MIVKKIIFLFLSFGLLMLTACSNKKISGGEITTKSETPSDSGYYDTLTAEQIEYLNTYCFMDEDEINRLTYIELVNIFLGSGLEMYNQTSGVYRFGIKYCLYDTNPEISEESYGSYYSTLGDEEGKQQITIDEAYKIVEKEQNIRLEDFLQYEYIRECKTEEDDVCYRLYLPVSDYKNVYVCTSYTEGDDGSIWILYPRFAYKGESDSYYYVFDFYYRDYYKDYCFSCISDEGEMDFPDEYVYGGYMWGTATDSLLMLEYCYGSKEKVNINKSFSIYKMIDGNEELIGEYKTSDSLEDKSPGTKDIDGKNVEFWWDDQFVYLDLTLATNGEKLEPGTYLIKFGIDKENYLYIEDEFVVK